MSPCPGSSIPSDSGIGHSHRPCGAEARPATPACENTCPKSANGSAAIPANADVDLRRSPEWIRWMDCSRYRAPDHRAPLSPAEGGPRCARPASRSSTLFNVFLLNFSPELRQLLGAEIGKYLAVDVQNRSQVLAGELDHFGKGRFVGNHIDRFIIHAVCIQPAHGLMAPAAIWLDEESDPFWFHNLYSRRFGTFTNAVSGFYPPIWARYCCASSRAESSAGSANRILKNQPPA